jgi:hypothetical protein
LTLVDKRAGILAGAQSAGHLHIYGREEVSPLISLTD